MVLNTGIWGLSSPQLLSGAWKAEQTLPEGAIWHFHGGGRTGAGGSRAAGATAMSPRASTLAGSTWAPQTGCCVLRDVPQHPAVTAACAAAGRHKHTGLVENASPRSSGRGAVGWAGSHRAPHSVRELQCLSPAQEDIKFNGCPEIIISGKHSLISVCLAGFYCLPFLRAPLCPDPFSQFKSSSFHPSFASHPFWLLLHLSTQGSPLQSL